jgi:phenylpropionate dioxygenase-like ring-hydroxylating dioxygenase large terminal subunit
MALSTTALVDNPALHGHWYAVAQGVELAKGPLQRMLLGQQLVVWRGPDGVVVAAPDRCPHREAPLSLGAVSDGVLACPYHGWEFGAEGRCVRVPSATDGVPVPPLAHLATAHAVERYGLVWLCLGEPTSGIPEIAQEDDDTYRRINNPVDAWQVSATRMADNFLDITHFPFVHVGTFGRAQDTRVPRVELEDLDDGWFGYRYEVEVNNPASSAATTGMTAKVLHRVMSSGFTLPFNVRSTIQYETGLEHILLLLSTPMNDVTSYFTFVVWRNDDFSVSAEEVIAFDRAIGAEDKAMLERLDGVLPLTQTGVVSVQADKASVEWRRQLAEHLGLR